MIDSIFGVVSPYILIHVTGFDRKPFTNSPAKTNRNAILTKAGLAAPIRVFEIDEWFDRDDKARASILADRPFILRPVAKNDTNIITDADRTLLEPDSHRYATFIPFSGGPVDLLPISVFVSNVAGGIPGSKPRVPDPTFDIVADLIADAGSRQPLIDSATQVEVSRLRVEPIVPPTVLTIGLEGVRRRQNDPGPWIVLGG